MVELENRKIAVRIENVRVGYGNDILLDAIELELLSSSINFITGPSGCGKSTLINILLGLEKPMNGQVKICGHDFFSKDRKEEIKRFKRDSLGVVFQQAALFDDEKVSENISFSISGGKKE